jgi:pyridoxine 4-dehydrogenase
MSNPKSITIATNSNNPLTVNRLGYGTMRLTGPEIYGEPQDRPLALQILKQAIENGVNLLILPIIMVKM